MKWYSYIICFVLVIVGAFFGVELYNQATATSYINGSIDISNQFSQEAFSYSNSAVVFYPIENAEAYTFETELVKVEDFDATRKEYQVTLNDFVLTDTTITAGAVNSNVRMDFYDVNGSVLCEGKMIIVIRFLSGKTQLVLYCADQDSATYFEQYFTDNGIRLTVDEILK